MSNKDSIYLPGLNGIRAIASLGVVISHTTLSLEKFNLNPYVFGSYHGYPKGWMLAGFGVSMFFALSGFLITYLLLREKKKNSQIHIGKFYFRRVSRIWPLYYVYIIVCILIYTFYNVSYESSTLLYYFFLAANIPFILGKTLPHLAHLWSIGVEEQFYLFWPWLNKLRISLLLNTSIFIICLLVGMKLILHFLTPGSLLENVIHVTRIHCMLIGGVGAILYMTKNKIFTNIIANRYSQSIAWLILFLIVVNKFHLISVLDNEFVSFITVTIIIGQITNKGIINLENRVLDFLGKISYGVYVIHPLIIFAFVELIRIFSPDIRTNYISVYSLIIFTTISVAFLSYRYLELPFLKYKSKKFSVVVSTYSRYVD